ncbi:LacI family DNA-binding transcriptional regulator [Nonomuraea sp. NN258]|uniref:LacI family DNA-binding transcriptional regulator n=1 Tax=Nonomuraea antri TaxID=2730852 RepID=UPI001569F602|nr:LacI family DNA-binding transcriptional regulator [Nonomuraea antri]NRQ40421.1 LacI family DNA-binding transcriptional regulator [Nonomuraea antri]
MARRKGLTIEDVARRAGVSVAAVSLALNDKGTLSEKTRAHIKRVAAELDYQADALARGLRRSPMGTIGMVLRPLDAIGEYAPSGVDFFSRLLTGAAVTAMDRGLGMMFVPNLLRSPVPAFAYSLDGYVVSDPVVDDPVVQRLEDRGIPYVSLGRNAARPDEPHWVSSDDDGSTRTVLEHFAAAGARDIALVAGTDSNGWNQDCEAAYRAWTAAAGLEARVLRAAEGAGIQGGQAVAARLLREGVPDAVLCATGRQAAGVLEELRGAGVSVPGRTLLATASDSEHARTSSPRISAIDMHPERLAEHAVDMLRGLIHGTPVAERVRLPSTFIVRESTTRNVGI